jgi:small-conductance mechanosensitive channel
MNEINEKLKEFFANETNARLVNSIIAVIICFAIYKVILIVLKKIEKGYQNSDNESKKGHTYFRLFKSTLRYVFFIGVVLLLLQVNGVDLTSLFAGLGIVSVIVGLALQDWLKDIIRGSSILSDGYFAVGDVVNYNGQEGEVLVIGLKTTKIKLLKNQNIVSIANRKIEEIEKVSKEIYINVPISYTVSVREAEEVIRSIVEAVKENDNVINCRYVAVNEITTSLANYYINVTCEEPKYKLQVRRDAQRTILEQFEEHNIKVPFTQIDVHQK